jgi:hypothetical protein
MKKALLLFAVAVAFVACDCCKKGKEVEIATLTSTIGTLNGQTVTFSGKAVVKEAGKFSVYGADSTVAVFVTADETLATAVECGKNVKVTGVVTACAQEAGKYYIVATAIDKACCKGDKKCCKKDSTNCPKDTTKKCHGEGAAEGATK